MGDLAAAAVVPPPVMLRAGGGMSCRAEEWVGEEEGRPPVPVPVPVPVPAAPEGEGAWVGLLLLRGGSSVLRSSSGLRLIVIMLYVCMK